MYLCDYIFKIKLRMNNFIQRMNDFILRINSLQLHMNYYM